MGALCLLCKHPEVQQSIFEELERVLKANGLTHFEMRIVKECHLLRAFVFESLRLCTVLPLNPHFNDKDVTVQFGGKSYFIRGGTTILINLAHIHRPSGSAQLDLSKWLNAETQKFRKDNNFFLFGQGARDCVGQTV